MEDTREELLKYAKNAMYDMRIAPSDVYLGGIQNNFNLFDVLYNQMVEEFDSVKEEVSKVEDVSEDRLDEIIYKISGNHFFDIGFHIAFIMGTSCTMEQFTLLIKGLADRRIVDLAAEDVSFAVTDKEEFICVIRDFVVDLFRQQQVLTKDNQFYLTDQHRYTYMEVCFLSGVGSGCLFREYYEIYQNRKKPDKGRFRSVSKKKKRR